MLGFELYQGREASSLDPSATGIVDRLITEADLTKAKGRTLYTDNWYTSVGFAEFLHEKYRWLFVGTIVPTEKKLRRGHDPPFLKLSNGALENVKRGWYREAVIEKKSKSGSQIISRRTDRC